MIYITGDCHGEFSKLSAHSFPEQKEMTKDDFVIICGDFGAVWNAKGASPSEEYWLKWLDEKPFTTLFVDGNHENFDRLNSEFEIIPFHGGKAHKLNNSVYHLMRGEIFELDGKTFFAFGGAQSHDIDDGILSREDFASDYAFREKARRWRKARKNFRIKNETWWEQELPCDEEIENAERNLERVNRTVDYVISHCAPYSIAAAAAFEKANRLTMYFEDLARRLSFKYWFFGHYHDDRKIMGKFILLYDQIIKLP